MEEVQLEIEKIARELEKEFKKCIPPCWEHYKGLYMTVMKYMYSNWKPGLTKDGKCKTYDYTFDRKRSVAYLDMEEMIDKALSTGKHRSLH